MRRSSLAATLLVSAAVLAACNDKAVPTAPVRSGESALNLTMAVDGCVDNTLLFAQVNVDVPALIVNLFTGNHESSTLSMWDNLAKDKLESRPLQNHIDNLAKWTLEQLAAGGLVDPDGAGILNMTTGAVRMLDLVFRCAGETPTTLPEPPEGFNAAFELVDPSTLSQQFNTSGGDAGTFVPGDGLETRTMLVMVKQPDEVTVNTPFPTLSNVVDIALAGGKLKPNRKLSVLFCPLQELSAGVSARAVVAHQLTAVLPSATTGEGVEYLDPPEGGNLVCADGHASAWRMEKGFMRQRAMQVASLAKKAWGFIGVKTLYAGHAAIGGSLGGFGSPMVVVDPYVQTGIVVNAIPTTTYGERVEFTATLMITGIPSSDPLHPAPATAWIGQPVTQSLVGMPFLTTPLPITAVVDGQTQTDAIDASGVANFSFTQVNAGTDQTAALSFPNTLNVPANAPLFGASNASRLYTVNPRPLSVSAHANSWVYGTPEPVTGEFTASAVQYFEPVTPVFSTVQNNLTNVGTYPGALVAGVNFGGARAENYVVTATPATLIVDPAPLHITSNTFTREYGVANPASTDASLTGDVTGEKNEQTILIQHTIDAALGATADANTDPGYTGAITPSLNGTYSNYVVTQVTLGTLRVLRAPIAFSINAGPSHAYGDANNFTSTLGATRNGDVLIPGFTPAASTLFTVGSHVITGSLSGPEVLNYDFTAPTSTLVITARPFGVVVADFSRQYGNANPATFNSTVTGTLVAGDGVALSIGTLLGQLSAASTYPGAITASLTGAASTNYAFTTTAGTFTITPRQLTGSIANAAKLAGQANPAFSGTVNGIVDAFLAAFVTTPAAPSAVGSYPITLDLSGTGGSNYSWTGTNGTLTVNSADIPNPIIEFERVETGVDRYHLNVTNRLAFPASMFAPAPDLAPCGLNTSSSQSWVDIYNATTGARIYGFCGLGAPEDLNGIWFGVAPGTQAPPVYITITDRRANVVYTSNTISFPAPPVASLTGTWQGTYSWACTQGSGSADVEFVIGASTNGGLSYPGTASYLGGSSAFTVSRHTFATISPSNVGALSATGLAARFVVQASTGSFVNNEFAGQISGTSISGVTLNGDSPGGGSGCSANTGPSGTFSINLNGGV